MSAAQSSRGTRPVYLDYAAATPVDPRVIEVMVKCLSYEGIFANPSSADHRFGWEAASAVDEARGQIASLVCGSSAFAHDFIFTSGATESNNLAILGLARALKKRGDSRRTVVTSPIEHKAVLEACEMLREEGYNVVYVQPAADGTTSCAQLEAVLTDDVFLVSLAQANSVLGSVNDVHALASLCRRRGIFFHTDCAQSVGYEKMDYAHSDISMVSLTPEKICGPKGVGALYISREQKVPLEPLIVGGGQEKGLRGGTVPTHQVAGMGEAFAIMQKEAASDKERFEKLRTRLKEQLLAGCDCQVNGNEEHHVPHILSMTFHGVDGIALKTGLLDTACSTGSACSSAKIAPSYILKAIGLSDADALASLRLSLGRFTTEEDIDRAAASILKRVRMLTAKKH